MNTNELSLERLRKELLQTTNIWDAIERVANSTGVQVGSHLETLLCREIGRELEQRVGSTKEEREDA